MKTKIVNIEALDQAALSDLAAAASLIRAGGTVVFPTETVYGLGADAMNPAAIKKIFAAKGRPDADVEFTPRLPAPAKAPRPQIGRAHV